MEVKLTIPDEKVDAVQEAMAGLYPIPMIANPEKPDEQIPQFTKPKWAKEVVKRFIIQQEARWRQVLEQRKAKFTEDNELVS